GHGDARPPRRGARPGGHAARDREHVDGARGAAARARRPGRGGGDAAVVAAAAGPAARRALKEDAMTRTFVLLAVLAIPAVAAAGGDDCVRGAPEAMFPSRGATVRSTAFHPVSSHEATEEVVFATGERLKIRNWGCEYFVLT